MLCLGEEHPRYSMEDVLPILKPKHFKNNTIIGGRVNKKLKNGG